MRLDWRRFGLPRLATAGVSAIVLIAVGAVAMQRTGPSDVETTQQVLSDASRVVAAHIETMRGEVKALRAAAAAVSARSAGLAADADRMDTEQGELANLTMILKNQAALLGPTPQQHARQDIAFVHTTGNTVISEADEVATHAKRMLVRAAALDGWAETNAVRAIDTALLRQETATLSATAAGMTRVGRLLQQSGDQLMRSLGR